MLPVLSIFFLVSGKLLPAKRLSSRLDRFREVELDFEGLDWIGQGFAHQVFVVFQNTHPEIKLIPLNMNADVEKMYRHVMQP